MPRFYRTKTNPFTRTAFSTVLSPVNLAPALLLRRSIEKY
jgi:hypothetical protein